MRKALIVVLVILAVAALAAPAAANPVGSGRWFSTYTNPYHPTFNPDLYQHLFGNPVGSSTRLMQVRGGNWFF